MRLPTLLLLVFATLGASAAAQEPFELEYRDAMRCSALHTFYMVVTEEDELEAKTLHKDVAIRWLGMAMTRDGEDGDRAEREHSQVSALLIDRLNSMEDDPEELNAFLSKALKTCEEMQKAYSEEFNSIEVD